MVGRTPSEALRAYIESLQQAALCITQDQVTLGARSQITVGVPYTVALNRGDPLVLVGKARVQFGAVHLARIVDAGPALKRARFTVATVQQPYVFSTLTGQEILSFHWTPEADRATEVTFPHLHIGPALLANQTVLRPKDLHKAHIPTGAVSLPAVIRLAIAEFGVAPLRPDWDEVLHRAEAALAL